MLYTYGLEHGFGLKLPDPYKRSERSIMPLRQFSGVSRAFDRIMEHTYAT